MGELRFQASAHALLAHETLYTKHKSKDEVTKNFKTATTEHYTSSAGFSERGPTCLPWLQTHEAGPDYGLLDVKADLTFCFLSLASPCECSPLTPPVDLFLKVHLHSEPQVINEFSPYLISVLIPFINLAPRKRMWFLQGLSMSDPSHSSPVFFPSSIRPWSEATPALFLFFSCLLIETHLCTCCRDCSPRVFLHFLHMVIYSGRSKPWSVRL